MTAILNALALFSPAELAAFTFVVLLTVWGCICFATFAAWLARGAWIVVDEVGRGMRRRGGGDDGPK